MKFKRILAFVLAAVMVFSFAACKKSDKEEGETYKIQVWVPDKAVDLTKKQIENFNKSNEHGITIEATVDAVSEADSATQMLNDVKTGADLFFFAQDQFARLVRGGALAGVPDNMVQTITAENAEGVVNAAKSGDKLYAYPLTNDNGYFMYYDKSVIPEADVGSLEKLVADCESAKKYFAFEQDTSAWYLASFFFGVGCKSEWITDEDGNFISIDDDFNSEKGLIAVKGMEKLVKSDYFLSSSKAAEFANGAAIVVSGTWDFEDAKTILKDNLGAAELPSFEVDGKTYHLGSFSGCKLLGVKPQDDGDKAGALHLLAQYLTSEEAQLERFNELAWGPANSKAADNEAVKANPALSALIAQNNATSNGVKVARPQGQIEGSWWDIAKVIGSEVKEASSEADLKKALQNYADKIDAVFQRTPEQMEAWGVIGAICGTNWDTDFPMTKIEEGVYKSEELELYKDEEYKFRKGGSWDVNFGADGIFNNMTNCKVEKSGKYVITLKIAEDEQSAEIILDLIEELPDPEPTEPAEPVETEEPAPAVEGWALIGAICGSSWDKDFPMTEQEDGSWKSEPIELKAGEQFKLRKDGAWDVNLGNDGMQDGPNFEVEADGTYIITLVLGEGEEAPATIEVKPAE